MDTQALQTRMRELISRHGPWTTNIHLGDGVYTIDRNVPSDHAKLVRFGQLISDLTGQPIAALRILDLACLEGEFAIEFARQGASVVGIEGRMENIEKGRLSTEALGLSNLQLLQDDVRNLSLEKHGSFDAVICSGILYHLDSPDVVSFLEKVGEVCKRCAIIDTHVSLFGGKSFVYKNESYAGNVYIEHHAKASPAERRRIVWASLDNTNSFWLTRPSLYNALTAAGFTSVYECHTPVYIGPPLDRVTLVALKGSPYRPMANSSAPLPSRWPETYRQSLTYHAFRYARRLARGLVMRLPYSITRLLRRIFSQ
jgi:SAM-dependent methyltransferase